MAPSLHLDSMVSDRGGIIESRHLVHAAIVDTTGHLLLSIGIPSRLTLARSVAKPAQALAILETGCFSQFSFDDEDLALVCASHSSEEKHISRAKNMLTEIGAGETNLACGPHPPLSETVNRAWIKRDLVPSPDMAIEAGFAGYHEPTHPMQLRVKRVLEDLCGEDIKDSKWGTDGCNLPTSAAPLKVLARIYSTFASAEDIVRANGETTPRIRHSARIFRAMSSFPEMVGGEGRFCTELMRAFKGGLIGKVDAEGTYCIGVRASEQTRKLGAVGALGIAVKIEDGNKDILYVAVVEILEKLELGTKEMSSAPASFRQKDRYNTVGVVIGSLTPNFTIRETDG